MVADGFEGTRVFAIILYNIHISNQINQLAFIYKCPKLLLLFSFSIIITKLVSILFANNIINENNIYISFIAKKNG